MIIINKRINEKLYWAKMFNSLLNKFKRNNKLINYTLTSVDEFVVLKCFKTLLTVCILIQLGFTS